MCDHISKQFEVRQKYSAARLIFNPLLGVWKCVKHGLLCLIYYFDNSRCVEGVKRFVRIIIIIVIFNEDANITKWFTEGSSKEH